MFSFLRRIFPLLTIIAFCLAALPVGSLAQINEAKTESIRKNIPAFPMPQIEQNAPQLALRTFGGDPCDTARPIGYGETVQSSLWPDDCPLGDGTFLEFYIFTGVEGQQVTIEMTSTRLDSYLALVGDPDIIAEDDDSLDGRNARIVVTLPTTGEFLIIANSAVPGAGDYELTLTKTPACTYSFSPSPQVPAIGGTFTFNVNTQTSCYWTAASNDGGHIQLANDGSMAFGMIHHRGSGTVTYTVGLNENETPYTGSIAVAGQTFNITQLVLVCTYAITPATTTGLARQHTGQITVDTPPGCPWTTVATTNGLLFESSWVYRGPATVSYLATGNYGPDPRTVTAMIGGQLFSLTQPGLNCSYSLSTNSISVPAAETWGTFRVTTQPDCVWSVGMSTFAMFYQTETVGTKDVTYVFGPNVLTQPRIGSVSFSGAGIYRTQIELFQAGVASVPITISGRVVSPSGVGLRNVSVTLYDIDDNPQYTTTSSFGYFTFNNVMTAKPYHVIATSKRYRFATSQFVANSDMQPLNFIGLE